MKSLLKVLGLLVGLVLVLAVGAYLWASYATNQALTRTYETHRVDFAVPFPLTQEELAQLEIMEDPGGAIALERARERGEHLIHARHACADCHGADLSGGVMIDAFPMGTLLGPNLTAGAGGKTAAYSPADWDRAVRHGVLPDGRPSMMPAGDFLLMTDRELSDMVAFIESVPPVDNEVAPPSFGPLGRILIATGQLPAAAAMIEDHNAPHELVPPPAEVSVEFGRHLAGTCTGCHGTSLAGGPIAGGDPSWPPARNLTPHTDGLAGWSYDDFLAAMREAVRPDGTPLVAPMTFVTPAANVMTDIELRALWTYLQSLPPTPTPTP
ncbi:MAG: cytochrome c [Gemmatimonadota bacterium]